MHVSGHPVRKGAFHVPSGSRVRGRFRVSSVEVAGDGERAVIEATIECEGVAKPVCVAQLVILTVP